MNPTQNRDLSMKNTIKIGADEIILWLRKNGCAVNVPNDGANGLGKKIYDLIVDFGGKKIEESKPSLWDENDSHVNATGLPKTSAQYVIKVDKLSELYLKISQW